MCEESRSHAPSEIGLAVTVMKTKAYNTTVFQSFNDDVTGTVDLCPFDPTTLTPANKYLIDPGVSDARAGDYVLSTPNTNLQAGISEYHHQSNLLRSEGYSLKKVERSLIGRMAPTYMANQIPNMCTLESSYDQADLLALDSYLCAYMFDPAAFGASPVIDMLHLTLDLSDKVVTELRNAIKTVPRSHFSLAASGPTKQLKNNHEAFERYAQFKNDLGENITLYWGMRPEIREKRKNHRLGKLSFNPARFTRKELKAFFHWLKNIIGVKGQEVIAKANVTRVDVALDVVGVPTNALLLDQPKSGEMKIILNRLRKNTYMYEVNQTVGTMSIGPSNSSKTTVYDKAMKLFYAGPKHIPLIWRERLVNISRIERKHNPADSVPYSLKALAAKTPYFLKGTVLYRPLLLSQLDTRQRAEVNKVNFTYWLRHGGMAELDKDVLDSFAIPLNTAYLKKLQKKELRFLTKVILEA